MSINLLNFTEPGLKLGAAIKKYFLWKLCVALRNSLSAVIKKKLQIKF